MKKIGFVVLLFSNLAFGQGIKHVGLLMDDFYSERWKKDSSVFSAKVKELGHKISIKACDSDTALQLRQLNELIDQGVDVLVIVAEDCKFGKVLVNASHKRKVPVIAYDRLILDSDVDFYISFDAFEVGRQQAKFVVDSLKGKGNVILINGPTSDENANQFRLGQLSVLQPLVDKGKMKILHDSRLLEWTLLAATMDANDVLASTKLPVQAAIVATDELAEGVMEAFTFSRPKEKPLITGQNADPLGLESVRKGTQGMTVYKNVEELATKAAVLAVEIAQRKSFKTSSFIDNGFKKVPFIRLEPIVITKKNIDLIFPPKK